MGGGGRPPRGEGGGGGGRSRWRRRWAASVVGDGGRVGVVLPLVGVRRGFSGPQGPVASGRWAPAPGSAWGAMVTATA